MDGGALFPILFISGQNEVVPETPQIIRVEPARPNVTPRVRHPFIIHGSGFVDGAIVTLESPADKLYHIPRTHNPFINIQPNRIEVEAGFYLAGNWRVWVTNPGNRQSNIFSFVVVP